MKQWKDFSAHCRHNCLVKNIPEISFVNVWDAQLCHVLYLDILFFKKVINFIKTNSLCCKHRYQEINFNFTVATLSSAVWAHLCCRPAMTGRTWTFWKYERYAPAAATNEHLRNSWSNVSASGGGAAISSSVDTLSSEPDCKQPKNYGINNKSFILIAHVIAEKFKQHRI